MNSEEILLKVIEKARANGFTGGVNFIENIADAREKVTKYPEPLIFDHGFAKALWGVQSVAEAYPDRKIQVPNDSSPIYIAHLQALVIEPSATMRIAYLGNFI